MPTAYNLLNKNLKIDIKLLVFLCNICYNRKNDEVY